MADYSEQVRSTAPKVYSKELVELLFNRPYCKIQFLVEAGIAQRQTAAKYLQTLATANLLDSVTIGREKIYVNAKFLRLLATPYGDGIDTSTKRVEF